MAVVEWPQLDQGFEGLNVTALQFLLRLGRLEWQDLRTTGVYDADTRRTVRQFQEWTAIDVDGVAGNQTFTKLTDGATIDSTVREGSQGDGVRAAQALLFKHGELKIFEQVDGVFGPITDHATRRFQERVHLKVDGVVGQVTWKNLFAPTPVG